MTYDAPYGVTPSYIKTRAQLKEHQVSMDALWHIHKLVLQNFKDINPEDYNKENYDQYGMFYEMMRVIPGGNDLVMDVLGRIPRTTGTLHSMLFIFFTTLFLSHVVLSCLVLSCLVYYCYHLSSRAYYSYLIFLLFLSVLSSPISLPYSTLKCYYPLLFFFLDTFSCHSPLPISPFLQLFLLSPFLLFSQTIPSLLSLSFPFLPFLFSLSFPFLSFLPFLFSLSFPSLSPFPSLSFPSFPFLSFLPFLPSPPNLCLHLTSLPSSSLTS